MLAFEYLVAAFGLLAQAFAQRSLEESRTFSKRPRRARPITMTIDAWINNSPTA